MYRRTVSGNRVRRLHGRVWTLDPQRPSAYGLAWQYGRVVALAHEDGGTQADLDNSADLVEKIPADWSIMPAFVDEHVHLLACAAAASSIAVDQPTVAGLLDSVRHAAATMPPNAWLRGWGYDDALVAERRHPTRNELDDAGDGRPVVLHHRTGHAAVLSSAALRAIGVSSNSDGVLHDAHEALARVPRLPVTTLRDAINELSRSWWKRGVVEVCDTTHTNGREALELFGAWSEDGTIAQRLRVMIGVDQLAHLDGTGYGGRVGGATVAHAKIMPSVHGDIAAAVAEARRHRFPVAVHAMTIEEVESTLDAIAKWPARESNDPSTAPAARDRIEHGAMVMPEQIARIARLGVEVVTQPTFLPLRWAKYHEQISDVEREWLWRIRSLTAAGVRVRFSSDAPVVPADPLDAVLAASDRPHARHEEIDRAAALRAAAVAPVAIDGNTDLLLVRARTTADVSLETEVRVVASTQPTPDLRH